MNLGRRRFLLGATAVVGASATPLWARWISDQMAKLQPKPRIEIVRRSGLMPVVGQPGLFQDLSTGEFINIRDFREKDLYDTIVLSDEHGHVYANHEITILKTPGRG